MIPFEARRALIVWFAGEINKRELVYDQEEQPTDFSFVEDFRAV